MKHRIVIKVGSNVLTRPEGKLDVTRMSAIVDQIAWLRRQGYDVILVSSGAVSAGRDELRTGRELTMKKNFEPGDEYANQRQCMNVMLENGVLPIVNENDTVSITGLMFTDNDELSGLIAQMMQAETLILLSNIDGVFTKNPNDPTAELIPEVQPGRDLSEYIQPEKSAFGRGGMHSKYTTASKVQQAGIRVIIANGERDNILINLIERKEDTPHTEFIPCN